MHFTVAWHAVPHVGLRDGGRRDQTYVVLMESENRDVSCSCHMVVFNLKL